MYLFLNCGKRTLYDEKKVAPARGRATIKYGANISSWSFCLNESISDTIKAVEANIIKLADDNRSFQWASNGRKLFEVPFEEHPYSAISAWFKTDDGLEVVKAIEKRLK